MVDLRAFRMLEPWHWNGQFVDSVRYREFPFGGSCVPLSECQGSRFSLVQDIRLPEVWVTVQGHGGWEGCLDSFRTKRLGTDPRFGVDFEEELPGFQRALGLL